jgi:hypothetical protein
MRADQKADIEVKVGCLVLVLILVSFAWFVVFPCVGFLGEILK